MPFDRLLQQQKTNPETLATPLVPTTVVNGANNNVVTLGTSVLRLVGPTGAFNITGFTAGTSGKLLVVLVAVAQTLTLKNENAGSVAKNRITTLTGADVTIVGPGVAQLVYDNIALRWVLMLTRP